MTSFQYRGVSLDKILASKSSVDNTGATGFYNSNNKFNDTTKTTVYYYMSQLNSSNTWQNLTPLNSAFKMSSSNYFLINQYFDKPDYFPVTLQTSSSVNLVAYYKEFYIDINNSVTNYLTSEERNIFSKLYVVLIGGGGSGGSGGGDDGTKIGTSGGTGGGGGVLMFYIINIQNLKYYIIEIGAGGSSVSGGSDNNGRNGNRGKDTIIHLTTINPEMSEYVAYAGGGGGGGGGHPSSEASPGEGVLGVYNETNTVYEELVDHTYSSNLRGCAGNEATYPGYNGLFNDYIKNNQDFDSSVPVGSTGLAKIGKGGAGTSGWRAVNSNPTTPGTAGYARVYYII